MTARWRSALLTLALMAPALALLLAVFVWPLLQYAALSLQAQSVFTGLRPVPVGAANWQRLLGDGRFWQDAGQTLRFAGFSVGLELVLGLAIALLLHRSWRGRGVVRSLTLLPWALPTTVMALGWRWIFNDPNGPINGCCRGWGCPRCPSWPPPSSPGSPRCWRMSGNTTPFVALLLLAGLQTIPADLYEALALEGGTPRQGLGRITLPLLRPYLFLACSSAGPGAGGCSICWWCSPRRPAGSTESLAVYAYLNAMRFLDFGYSATVMLGMFLLLLLCTLALVLWRRLAPS